MSLILCLLGLLLILVRWDVLVPEQQWLHSLPHRQHIPMLAQDIRRVSLSSDANHPEDTRSYTLSRLVV